MKDKEKTWIGRGFFYLKVLAAMGLAAPLIFYVWRICLRPRRTNLKRELFPGVIYSRKVFSEPRPYVAHIVEIDLLSSGMKPLVTASDIQQLHGSNSALTTSSFMREFNLDLAINGSFFYPFAENTPWDYYPRAGEPVKALGANISNGQEYGKKGAQWNILCFAADNSVQIAEQQCPPQTVQGIAGMDVVVKNGKSTISSQTKAYPFKFYPRSLVGLDRAGTKLWLMVVDGKQPFYSEGVTLEELAQLAVDLGCDRALNLDGGGSSTLVVKQNGKIKVLNAPIHTRILMRERPIANHLGFF